MDIRSMVKGALRRMRGGRTYALVPTMPAKDKKAKEIGRSGTKQFGGFIVEDQNTDFIGQNAIRIYEEMRKTDATVAGTLRALRLPILAAEWRIDTADKEDDQANEIAEFVRSNLFDTLEGGFHAFLRQALTHLDFGFSYFEKVYEVKDGGEVRLRKLAQRLQTAHWKWMMDDDPTTPGVTQVLLSVDRRQDPDAKLNPQIPMSKLVLFTHDKEGDNHEGVSVLRSAYKHFHFKDTLYRIDGVKHERGAGVLVIKVPKGATQKALDAAEELGENFKENDKSYIVQPDGWETSLLSDGIKDQTGGLMASVGHHDRMIMTNILAQFLDLGSDAKGSFALSKDQTSFFAMILMDIAANVSCVMNDQCIKELVDLNYGPQEKYPTLCSSKIGDTDVAVMAEALSKLCTSGLIKKDPQLFTWIHDTFGLPKVSPEDFEADATDPNAKPGDEEPAMDPVTGEPIVQPAVDPKTGKPLPPAKTGKPAAEKPPNPSGVGEPAEYSEMKYWRPLTAAEKRVSFPEIGKFFDDSESEIAAELAKLTDAQKAKLLKDSERIIAENDVAAVNDIALPGETAIAGQIADQAKAAFEKGKAMAAGEMGVAIPVTTAYAKKHLAAKIELYMKRRADAITDPVKARLLHLMNNDVGKAAALFDIEKTIQKNATTVNDGLSARVGVEFFNEGRYLTFDDMKEQLHGLQRSEILDEKTCTMCMSLDGRVVSASDPFAQIDQVHDGCRGGWVGILKTDADLPAVKPIPKTLLDRFERTDGIPSTNAFDQPPKPVVTKDSRAARKIKDGDLEV